MRILVCEDDDQIAETLTIALSKSGFGVEREKEGEGALFRGETENFDAVVLDLGLPKWTVSPS